MGDLVCGKRPRKGNPKQELVRVKGFFPAILTSNEWGLLQERLNIRRETSRGRTHVAFICSAVWHVVGIAVGPWQGR